MQVAGAAGQAPLAIDAALGEIARLEASLSTWHDDSTLSAYNAGHLATEALPHDVAAVLALCERWRVRTSDAFSCRLGSLIAQWRQADLDDRMPERGELRRQARVLAATDLSATGRLDPGAGLDRQSVVSGTGVNVRVDLGCGRIH